MISMRLEDNNTKKRFCVGTYHMPCMFKYPSVMVTHCSLSAQHIHKFSKGDPYVYTGDFNIKPTSSQYQLLTEGDLDKNNSDYPPIVPGDDWKPALVKPLRSAYKVKNGEEPNFTNYAKTEGTPEFIDTLDYIFLSDEWHVQDVLPLPHRDEVQGPLPNEAEPSDHVLISAELSL